jgi:hypothetical protein
MPSRPSRKYYDIFNGDADGLCALHQLRLAFPREAEAVTGVKRDTALLTRVEARKGDQLTVLDISMKTNGAALRALLERGVKCEYFDHHDAGTIPRHRNLSANIDTSPEVCTSLIVDRRLAGRFRAWAVVAAFGDNLIAPAIQAAAPLEFDHTELARLHELGDCMNYNAYGDSVDDLHYHPVDLYQAIHPYEDPREFLVCEPVFEVLKGARREDSEHAADVRPEFADDEAALYVLPNAAWSRRVHGVFGNELARAQPQRAHAVLVTHDSGYAVSVRAPLADPHGAGALCGQFESGGGREGAGGINHLPRDQFDAFADAFRKTWK